jgi:spermidine synthase
MDINRKRTLFFVYIIVLITGISGMLGQLLLVRELLIVFLGNELTIGFILGNWLIFEALGAFSGKYLGRSNGRKNYCVSLSLFSLFLVINLFLSRSINQTLFNLYPGETANIVLVFIQSIILLAPVSFTHGILYPLGCILAQEIDDPANTDKIPGLVYLIETAGSLIGGIAFTFLLSTRFHSLEIALVLLMIHLTVLLILIRPHCKYILAKIVFSVIVMFIITVSIFFSWISQSLHTVSLQLRWPEQSLYYYENSAYSNYVITRQNNQFVVYQDGRPLVSIPNPDKILQKDLIHIVAGMHPNPAKVLIVGSGPGGYIEELLLHPVKELHYVEIDCRLPAILNIIPDEQVKTELTNPIVKSIYTDVRRHLSLSNHHYDLIILALMQPGTLQENRIFTKQFFELVKNNLNESGIFFFTTPGAPHLYTYEVLPLNACLLKTAGLVFPYVEILPGEYTYYFAGKSKLTIDSRQIYNHLKQRNLTEDLITLDYLANRFDYLKTNVSATSIKEMTVRVNEDLNPAGFYYDTLASVGLYSHRLFSVLYYLENFPLLFIIITFIFFISLIKHLKAKSDRLPEALNYVIFSTGLTVMALQLLALFSLQVTVGYLYQMIGLLFAAFMGGSMLGSTFGIKQIDKKNLRLVIRNTELKIVLTIPLIILLALLINKYNTFINPIALIILFSLINFTSGFLSGSQYPVATYLKSIGGFDKTGGSLYAVDLLGGWLGGTLFVLLLFPLLGLIQTLILLGTLKLSSFSILYRELDRNN